MSRNSYPTPSPQARGRVNAERLAKWVEETPILEVPLNQFGRVARERVCKMLQIAPSTVRTNENIKRHFDELDGRLTEVARPSVPPPSDGKTASTILTEALELNLQTTTRLRALEAKVARLQYLEDYGVFLSDTES